MHLLSAINLDYYLYVCVKVVARKKVETAKELDDKGSVGFLIKNCYKIIVKIGPH